MTDKKATPLEELQAKRAKRKEELEQQRDAQLLIDLTAIDELEQLHGDSNISVREIDYIPGLPVCCAVRTPTDLEIKKYRAALQKRDRNGNALPSGPVDAAHELVDSNDTVGGKGPLLVYPDRATFEKMLEARPGFKVQLGVDAVKLSTSRAEAAGKD